MKIKVGDRVGAIFGYKEDGSVDFFGFGVYEGEFIPMEAVGPFAEIGKKAKATNPRICLDSGKVVYGCECWWGGEKKIKRALEGKKVNQVDVDEIRAAFKKREQINALPPEPKKE